MKCADPECNRDATRKLRGVAMCEAYYVEALEHSAHLDFGQWDGKDQTYVAETLNRKAAELYRSRFAPHKPEAKTDGI